jgi:hypothetical protein
LPIPEPAPVTTATLTTLAAGDLDVMQLFQTRAKRLEDGNLLEPARVDYFGETETS